MSSSINRHVSEAAVTKTLSYGAPFLPKLPTIISHSFLNQITSHKAHSSSFFILFYLYRSKFSKKTPKLAESSKKRKGVSTSSVAIGTQSHGASRVQTTPIPPSISSSTLFSSKAQRIRYTSFFSSRSILDLKFLDLKFFDDEMFECFQAFQNSRLIQFMSMKLPFYPELVRAFYSNLEIQEGTLVSEVYGIKMVIDESLFFELPNCLVMVYHLRAPLMRSGSWC